MHLSSKLGYNILPESVSKNFYKDVRIKQLVHHLLKVSYPQFLWILCKQAVFLLVL